jgi:type IV pilus assembly protein PilX
MFETAINGQRGMALIVSLILLLSLTILGLAAMQNTSLEERMAGSVRAENIALQGAEAGLRAGETWLAARAALPEGAVTGAPASDGIWAEGNLDPAVVGPYSVIPNSRLVGDLAWWFQWVPLPGLDDLWAQYGTKADLPLIFVAQQGTGANAVAEQSLGDAVAPRYVIEEMGYERDHLVVGQQRDLFTSRYRFKITARGLDAGGRGEVLLQSTYARRF